MALGVGGVRSATGNRKEARERSTALSVCTSQTYAVEKFSSPAKTMAAVQSHALSNGSGSAAHPATKPKKSKRLSWTLGRKKGKEEVYVADRSGESFLCLSQTVPILTILYPARRALPKLAAR